METVTQHTEQDENEVRKAFVTSERHSIAEAMAEKMEERRGRPSKEKPGICPEIPKGVETREYAAQRAGFGNDATFRQAAKVVDEATPELCQAMDDGLWDAGDALPEARLLLADPVRGQRGRGNRYPNGTGFLRRPSTTVLGHLAHELAEPALERNL